jgi:hypothetical protein
MDPDADEKSETFYMQSKESKPISLKFHDDFQFPKHAFVQSGRITIAWTKPCLNSGNMLVVKEWVFV